jgi:hypothetical protein
MTLPLKTIGRAVGQKMSAGQSTRRHSAVSAAVAGAAVAAGVYRGLRSR